MITAGLILVLVYSPFQITVEARDDALLCQAEAGRRIGEKLPVLAWDSLGGSNPIPVVVAAFCAPGAVAEDAKR